MVRRLLRGHRAGGVVVDERDRASALDDRRPAGLAAQLEVPAAVDEVADGELRG